MTIRKKDTIHTRFILSSDHNIIDDRSGFKLKASEAIIDHEGRITSKDNFDERTFDDMPREFPIDNPMTSITGKPEDTIAFEADCVLDYEGRWDTIEATWDCLLNEWD